jgi:hypothetical protein
MAHRYCTGLATPGEHTLPQESVPRNLYFNALALEDETGRAPLRVFIDIPDFTRGTGSAVVERFGSAPKEMIGKETGGLMRPHPGKGDRR